MTARSASRAPGSLNAHTAMKLITGPVELPLSMVAEYRLDMLGPWESANGAGTEALTTSWVSPDPLHDGGNIFYSEITALYTNGLRPTKRSPPLAKTYKDSPRLTQNGKNFVHQPASFTQTEIRLPGVR